MGMHALLAALVTLQGPIRVPTQDTSLFITREEFIRLYTDCTESRWPWGVEDMLVPKTDEEVRDGVAKRRGLEARWRAYFAERAGDSITPTPEDAWVYPLAIRGRLLSNFNNPRDGGPHEALDIFVREGTGIRAPAAGVVVASGDDWVGSWRRRVGLVYESGGLSRRAGNGVVIFDPALGAYFYFAHLRPGVRVRTGDIVRAGQLLGTVGNTGNASQPGHGRHLHFAYKRAGEECGVDGVLVPIDPYPQVRAARTRLDAVTATGH